MSAWLNTIQGRGCVSLSLAYQRTQRMGRDLCRNVMIRGRAAGHLVADGHCLLQSLLVPLRKQNPGLHQSRHNQPVHGAWFRPDGGHVHCLLSSAQVALAQAKQRL